jgi:hypothetical protein
MAKTSLCDHLQLLREFSSVTITSPSTAFADTNYTVVCSPEKQIASPYAASWFFIPLGGRTTSTFVVTMETLNSLATSLNSLDCIGIHVEGFWTVFKSELFRAIEEYEETTDGVCAANTIFAFIVCRLFLQLCLLRGEGRLAEAAIHPGQTIVPFRPGGS